MSSRLERRVASLERACAARRRDHLLWCLADETQVQVDARIAAMIASGQASRNDRFVVFRSKSPDDEAPGADGAAL
jgi:hypothetical protein